MWVQGCRTKCQALFSVGPGNIEKTGLPGSNLTTYLEVPSRLQVNAMAPRREWSF